MSRNTGVKLRMWSRDVPLDSAAILFVTDGNKKVGWVKFDVMCDRYV
jgi:hypothetical protein